MIFLFLAHFYMRVFFSHIFIAWRWYGCFLYLSCSLSALWPSYRSSLSLALIHTYRGFISHLLSLGVCMDDFLSFISQGCIGIVLGCEVHPRPFWVGTWLSNCCGYWYYYLYRYCRPLFLNQISPGSETFLLTGPVRWRYRQKPKTAISLFPLARHHQLLIKLMWLAQS